MKFDNQNPIFTFLLMGVGFGLGSYMIRRLLGGHSHQTYKNPNLSDSNYQQIPQNPQNKDSKIFI